MRIPDQHLVYKIRFAEKIQYLLPYWLCGLSVQRNPRIRPYADGMFLDNRTMHLLMRTRKVWQATMAGGGFSSWKGS